MRILVVHEKYRSSAPSGELGVFKDEVDVLRRAGHSVHTLVADNDVIDTYSPFQKVSMALGAIWSPTGYKTLSETLKKARPDVVHFHNTFPLISPSAYDACHNAGIPVVQTLHNYRTICPSGTLYRNGSVCKECIGAIPTPAVRHGCYRNSSLQSVPAAALVWTHRMLGTWQRKVDLFIALTPTQRALLIDGGLPPARVALKPNLMSNPPAARYDDDGFAIYLGRLSEEKGIVDMLDAFEQMPDKTLHIYGGGPLKEYVQQRTAGMKNVTFFGHTPHATCVERLRGARLLIQPSIWNEPCPMTVREAYAAGTPVIATRIGGLKDMVEHDVTGLHVAPNDPQDMAKGIAQLMDDDVLHARLARGARQKFDQCYAPDVGLEALVACYERAIKDRRRAA